MFKHKIFKSHFKIYRYIKLAISQVICTVDSFFYNIFTCLRVRYRPKMSEPKRICESHSVEINDTEKIHAQTVNLEVQVIDCKISPAQGLGNSQEFYKEGSEGREEGEFQFSINQEQTQFQNTTKVIPAEQHNESIEGSTSQPLPVENYPVAIVEENQSVQEQSVSIIVEEAQNPSAIIIEQIIQKTTERVCETVEASENASNHSIETVRETIDTTLVENKNLFVVEDDKQVRAIDANQNRGEEKFVTIVEEHKKESVKNDLITEGQEVEPCLNKDDQKRLMDLQPQVNTTHRALKVTEIIIDDQPEEPVIAPQLVESICQPLPQANNQPHQPQSKPSQSIETAQPTVPIPQYEQNTIQKQVVSVLQTVMDHMRITTKLAKVYNDNSQCHHQIIFEIEPLLPIQALLEASENQTIETKENKAPKDNNKNKQKSTSEFKASLAKNQVSQELFKDRCVLFAKFTNQTLPEEFVVLFDTVQNLFEKVQLHQQSLYSLAEIQPQKQLILKILIFNIKKQFRIQLQKLQISSEQFLERKNRQLLQEMQRLYKSYTLTKRKCDQLSAQIRKLRQFSDKPKPKQNPNISDNHNNSNQQIAKSIKFAMEVVKSVNKRSNSERDQDGYTQNDEETKITQNGEEMSLSERNLRKKIKKTLQETLSSNSHLNGMRK